MSLWIEPTCTPHPPIKNEWLCEFMDIFTTKNTGEVVTNGMCLFEGLVWEVRFFSHTKFCRLKKKSSVCVTVVGNFFWAIWASSNFFFPFLGKIHVLHDGDRSFACRPRSFECRPQTHASGTPLRHIIVKTLPYNIRQILGFNYFPNEVAYSIKIWGEI